MVRETKTMNNDPRKSKGGCFDETKKQISSRDVKVSASYMEIYNENVNDLLDSNKKNLEIRESKDGVVVDQLTSIEASCAQGLIDILHEGELLRSVAETKQNSKSSRGHTVFRINIEITDKNTQTGRRTTKSS